MLIIKKLRLKKGWSQADLAEFSGMSIRTIQRIEKGANPSLESLKALAAVFDLDVADFQQGGTMGEQEMSLKEKRAFEYVQNLKGFYGHLFTYLTVVAGLFIVNYLASPSYIWAKWAALGWGVGLVVHGIQVFKPFTIFGPEWEKKKVEKILGRKL